MLILKELQRSERRSEIRDPWNRKDNAETQRTQRFAESPKGRGDHDSGRESGAGRGTPPLAIHMNIKTKDLQILQFVTA